MKKVMALSLGKSSSRKNRHRFIEKLIKSVKRNLRNLDHGRIYHNMGKIYVEVSGDNEEKLINRLKHVFGIVYIAPTYEVETNWETIEEAVVKIVDETLKDHPEYKTFKVKTNRGIKSSHLIPWKFLQKLVEWY